MTFNQLAKADRATAVKRAESILVNHIVEGVVEFKMPKRSHEKDLKSILSDARKQDLGIDETAKRVMAHKEIGFEIRKLALVIAEGSWWTKDIQPIMEGV